jgi:hypothetical protein
MKKIEGETGILNAIPIYTTAIRHYNKKIIKVNELIKLPIQFKNTVFASLIWTIIELNAYTLYHTKRQISSLICVDLFVSIIISTVEMIKPEF